MVEDQKVQEFLGLRSTGLSFGRIAEQLGVAKSTLINWSHRTLASKQERPRKHIRRVPARPDS